MPDLSRAALIAKVVSALPDLTPDALARVEAIIDAPAARGARVTDSD
ncbi:MAG: hypothetical protein H6809_04870 [Phycisphaeraceae bacterium]|nr:hypothetical protein [Phycisphaeraceae bacterium]